MRLMCEISQSMGENCYFVVDESTNKAIVIDPGENGKKLNKKIDDFVKKGELLATFYTDKEKDINLLTLHRIGEMLINRLMH